MHRPQMLDFPVGEKPGWELEDGDEGDEKLSKLKSIAESHTIVQSLRQSRERWLSLFSKFSSKARGAKPPDTVPPPHTIQTRGKCALEIGPHIFPDTVFYEVHYLPSQTVSTSKPTYFYQQPGSGGLSSTATTPYASSYAPLTYHPASVLSSNTVTSSPSESQKSATPIYSSLTSVTTITPALINQVNSAASSNPTLANLLQLAASGKANPEQLKTLGLLIQSLATPAHTNAVAGSAQSSIPSQPITQHKSDVTSISTSPLTSVNTPLPTPSSVKEFDLVIEFRETPSERWVFPRGPVVCERLLDSRVTDAAYDILITTCIPFSLSPAPDSGLADGTSLSHEKAPSQVVTFRLRSAPLAVWDTVSRWAGGEEEMNQSRKILKELEGPARVYLAHQLSEGPLLTQLQAAVTPPFNMKPINLGPAASKPRRKPAQRKTDGSTPRRKPIEGSESSAAVTPSKRRRVSQAKAAPAVTQIQCVTCNQTDVPLILGGRFCRPCVDSGKATTEIPQAFKFSSYTPVASTTLSLPSDKVTAASLPIHPTPPLSAQSPHPQVHNFPPDNTL